MFHQSRYINRPPVNETVGMKAMPPEILGCDFCDEGWQSETDVELHRRAMHKQELHEMLRSVSVCNLCIVDHVTPEELLKHIKTYHLLSSEDAVRVEKEIFICNICSNVFFNKQMLVCHFALVHKGLKCVTGPINCIKCSKKIHIRSLWNHFQIENILSISTCPICGKKCKNTDDLSRHTKTHTSYYYCSTCLYYTKDKVHFKEHISKDTERAKAFHEMDVKFDVEKYFVSVSDHVKQLSLQKAPFRGLRLPKNVSICVMCRQICTSIDEMREHFYVHLWKEVPKEEKKKNSCSCGEEFFNKVLLKQHLLKCKEGNTLA